MAAQNGAAQAVQAPPGLSPYRCETCDFYIQSKKNFFGVNQPFCSSPKVIEFLKAKPETVVDTPTHWSIKDRTINEGDQWYWAMSKWEAEHIGVLGCMGHSKYPDKRDRYEAVKV